MSSTIAHRPLPKPVARKKLQEEIADQCMKEALNTNTTQSYQEFTSMFPHLHEDSPVVLSKPSVYYIENSHEVTEEETPFIATMPEVTERHQEEIEVLQAITITSTSVDRPKRAIKLHNLVDEPEVEEEEEVFYVPSFAQSKNQLLFDLTKEEEEETDIPTEEGNWEDAPNVPLPHPQIEAVDSQVEDENCADDLIEPPPRIIEVTDNNESSFDTPIEDFSIDPDFDYENVKLTPKMSVETLKAMWKAGELKDWV